MSEIPTDQLANLQLDAGEEEEVWEKKAAADKDEKKAVILENLYSVPISSSAQIITTNGVQLVSTEEEAWEIKASKAQEEKELVGAEAVESCKNAQGDDKQHLLESLKTVGLDTEDAKLYLEEDLPELWEMKVLNQKEEEEKKKQPKQKLRPSTVNLAGIKKTEDAEVKKEEEDKVAENNSKPAHEEAEKNSSPKKKKGFNIFKIFSFSNKKKNVETEENGTVAAPNGVDNMLDRKTTPSENVEESKEVNLTNTPSVETESKLNNSQDNSGSSNGNAAVIKNQHEKSDSPSPIPDLHNTQESTDANIASSGSGKRTSLGAGLRRRSLQRVVSVRKSTTRESVSTPNSPMNTGISAFSDDLDDVEHSPITTQTAFDDLPTPNEEVVTNQNNIETSTTVPADQEIIDQTSSSPLSTTIPPAAAAAVEVAATTTATVVVEESSESEETALSSPSSPPTRSSMTTTTSLNVSRSLKTKSIQRVTSVRMTRSSETETTGHLADQVQEQEETVPFDSMHSDAMEAYNPYSHNTADHPTAKQQSPSVSNTSSSNLSELNAIPGPPIVSPDHESSRTKHYSKLGSTFVKPNILSPLARSKRFGKAISSSTINSTTITLENGLQLLSTEEEVWERTAAAEKEEAQQQQSQPQQPQQVIPEEKEKTTVERMDERNVVDSNTVSDQSSAEVVVTTEIPLKKVEEEEESKSIQPSNEVKSEISTTPAPAAATTTTETSTTAETAAVTTTLAAIGLAEVSAEEEVWEKKLREERAEEEIIQLTKQLLLDTPEADVEVWEKKALAEQAAEEVITAVLSNAEEVEVWEKKAAAQSTTEEVGTPEVEVVPETHRESEQSSRIITEPDGRRLSVKVEEEKHLVHIEADDGTQYEISESQPDVAIVTARDGRRMSVKAVTVGAPLPPPPPLDLSEISTSQDDEYKLLLEVIQGNNNSTTSESPIKGDDQKTDATNTSVVGDTVHESPSETVEAVVVVQADDGTQYEISESQPDVTIVTARDGRRMSIKALTEGAPLPPPPPMESNNPETGSTVQSTRSSIRKSVTFTIVDVIQEPIQHIHQQEQQQEQEQEQEQPSIEAAETIVAESDQASEVVRSDDTDYRERASSIVIESNGLEYEVRTDAPDVAIVHASGGRRMSIRALSADAPLPPLPPSTHSKSTRDSEVNHEASVHNDVDVASAVRVNGEVRAVVDAEEVRQILDEPIYRAVETLETVVNEKLQREEVNTTTTAATTNDDAVVHIEADDGTQYEISESQPDVAIVTARDGRRMSIKALTEGAPLPPPPPMESNNPETSGTVQSARSSIRKSVRSSMQSLFNTAESANDDNSNNTVVNTNASNQQVDTINSTEESRNNNNNSNDNNNNNNDTNATATTTTTTTEGVSAESIVITTETGVEYELHEDAPDVAVVRVSGNRRMSIKAITPGAPLPPLPPSLTTDSTASSGADTTEGERRKSIVAEILATDDAKQVNEIVAKEKITVVEISDALTGTTDERTPPLAVETREERAKSIVIEADDGTQYEISESQPDVAIVTARDGRRMSIKALTEGAPLPPPPPVA